MKIGELAKHAGCTAETIRFYERTGLLPKTSRTAGNYRFYDESHLERLRLVRNCRALGMALGEIRALLAATSDPHADCATVDQLLEAHIGHVAARLAELAHLQEQLLVLRARCHDGTQAVRDCGIIQALNGTPDICHLM
ncbi:MAG: Cd(II)/Pb(II)-responsive transcriptional regulator [Zoogloeaceae bacterium]|jgi:Cd(II)/Pb(II)-responsive transcriptional regulator|nr:Cd(II)/Pb(II)-responsive transcriptional regulator [Zoogloeaceae bacterium]